MEPLPPRLHVYLYMHCLRFRFNSFHIWFTSIPHLLSTCTGVGRIADQSYTITKLPKPKKVKTDSDDSDESSSDDDDEDDIHLHIKLEDFLPKYIFPLMDKAVKPKAGR